MIKKIMITPWFGKLPEWFDKYSENMKSLQKYGYDWLLTTDLKAFNERTKKKLGFESSIIEGTGKVHDYRCAFGELFEEEIRGYDFWGHTDFDCVYGNVSKFVTDELLNEVDIQSNHHNYICGPWTLYRNIPKINSLFRESPNWEKIMRKTKSTGWVEMEYTQIVDSHADSGDIRRKYTHWQGKNPNKIGNLKMKDGCLYDGDEEIMMFHFNRRLPKKYPLI